MFNFSSYFSSSTFSLCLFFCLLSLSRQRTLWQWTEISCTEFINMINDIDEMSWNTFNASSDFSDSIITPCHIKTSLHRNQNLLYSKSSLKSTLLFYGTRRSKIKTATNQALTSWTNGDKKIMWANHAFTGTDDEKLMNEKQEKPQMTPSPEIAFQRRNKGTGV